MTSKEIQQIEDVSRTERWWLKEVAYQLALLNEKNQEPTPEPPRVEVVEKRGPGRTKKVA